MQKTLVEILMGFVLLVVVVALLGSSGTTGLVDTMTTTVAGVGTSLRKLLIAIAVPALLLGGLVAISPKHRALGLEIMGGSLLGLTIAAVGPALVPWLTAHLDAAASSIFRG